MPNMTIIHPMHPSIVPDLERRQTERRSAISAALVGYMNAAFPVEHRSATKIVEDNAFVAAWERQFHILKQEKSS